jgi:hypothetical protein
MIREFLQSFTKKKKTIGIGQISDVSSLEHVSNSSNTRATTEIAVEKYTHACNIQLSIVKARDILKYDDSFKDTLDVFIICKIKDQEKKTRVWNTKLEPNWEESFVFTSIYINFAKEKFLDINFELVDFDNILESTICLGVGRKTIPLVTMDENERERIETYMSEVNLEFEKKLSAILNVRVTISLEPL